MKPKKIDHKMGCDSRKHKDEVYCNCGALQHNTLCDDWEAFLPTKQELLIILLSVQMNEESHYFSDLTTVIHNRLKGE